MFTGVVAHLCDALDLIGALDRGAAVPIGRVAPFDDRGAQAGDFSAHRDSERRCAGFGLTGARVGKRPFGAAAVEQGDHCLRHQDAADVAAAERRRFVPATISGSGIRRRSAARAERRAAAAAWRSARSSPRTAAACSTSASTVASAAGAGGAGAAARRDASIGSAKKAASAACTRARSLAAAARSASKSRTSRSARSRSKPAASPAASRLARNLAQVMDSIARDPELAFSDLRGCELREGEPQISPGSPYRFVRAADAGVDQGGSGAHL
jgi:hypothetical protein